MKKLILLLLLLPLFIGCDKDDDTIHSLNGTTWECLEDEGWYKGERIIEFQETTWSSSTKEWNEGDGSNVTPIYQSGTYTYDPPKVRFTEKEEILIATISGNKMVAGEFVYIKK